MQEIGVILFFLALLKDKGPPPDRKFRGGGLFSLVG